jgi:hypothetical protein
MRHVAVPGWVWCSGALLTCVCNPGLEGMTVVVRGVCRRRVRRAAGGVMIRSRCEILEGEAAVRAAFEGRDVSVACEGFACVGGAVKVNHSIDVRWRPSARLVTPFQQDR